MTPIDVIGSQPGRALRVVAGLGIITAGLRRVDGRAGRWRSPDSCR